MGPLKKARVIFYTYKNGGRPCVPVNNGYAPYLRSARSDMDLPVRMNGLPSLGEYDRYYEVDVELMYHPKLDYSTIFGENFLIIEGPKIVGEGYFLGEREVEPDIY